jgi:gliding motility-associated-like protein
MKKKLLMAVLLVATRGFTQCPFPAQLNTTGSCLGATLSVSTSATLSTIVWYNGTTVVSTATATLTASSGITVAGGNGSGSNANQIALSYGLYVDPSGTVYVSDAQNNRVQKWAPGATTGVTVAGGNGAGSNANQFNSPEGIFVDGSGNIYVADNSNNRIQEWTPGATSGTTIAGGNGAGANANQLNLPIAVVVDGSGNIYISDNGNNRVQKWASGATGGTTVAGGNGAGANANQLNDPDGIALDGSGNIYIADVYNARVQEWAAGATTGVTVAGGNGPGSAANQLLDPSGVYTDGSGNVYVADNNNDRIQEWSPGAATGITVAGGNGFGSAANQLAFPSHVYMDASGNLYVDDVDNNRVQEFKQTLLPPNATYKPVTAGVYTAAITNNTACPVTTNAITIDPLVSPGISITQSAITVCTDQPAFVALSANGGASPAYQWEVNGKDAGTNSAVFTAVNFPPHGMVACMLTSTAACTTTATAVSNNITVPTPPPVTLTNNGNYCPGDTLVVSSGDPLSQIIWNNGSAAVNTATASLAPGSTLQPTIDTTYIASTAGAYTATVTNNIGCAATTNQVIVNPTTTPAVSISSPVTAACKGSPLTFNASPTNGGPEPVYQWQINGVNTGSNSAAYTTDVFTNGDAITCSMTSNANCPLPATVQSNPIPLTVIPSPQLDTGQIFYLAEGQSVTLNPGITGDSSGYSFIWSPGQSLSDSTAADPVANPAKSTAYTLTVTSAEGCQTSTTIKVAVFTRLYVPNAFTPNGDGHNDIFYILNGPPGSRIRDLAIYDRWGVKVFQVHNAPTADPAFGWNGNYKGAPAPTGAYVYVLAMSFADGTQQAFQGTIMLIR